MKLCYISFTLPFCYGLQIFGTPGNQSHHIHTPVSTSHRRWSDTGDYLIRKMQDQNSQMSLSTQPKGTLLHQSSAASIMLVQEICKLENLQDELGDDANRALEALQKEVECLQMAQAGMNHDAASTIKNLQDEIKTMRCLRVKGDGGIKDQEDATMVHASLSLNPAMLREELSRLGEKDKTDADAAIATLEEQLESVQKSLDKMALDNHVSFSIDPITLDNFLNTFIAPEDYPVTDRNSEIKSSLKC